MSLRFLQKEFALTVIAFRIVMLVHLYFVNNRRLHKSYISNNTCNAFSITFRLRCKLNQENKLLLEPS